jgi:hypothetical protein
MYPIKLNKSNLYLHGINEDKIQLGFAGKQIFKVEKTKLPLTASILSNEKITKFKLGVISNEINSYIQKNGTAAQQKTLKLEKKRLIII